MCNPDILPYFDTTEELGHFVRAAKYLSILTTQLTHNKYIQIDIICNLYKAVKDRWIINAKLMMIHAFQHHHFICARIFFLLLHFLESNLSSASFGCAAWGFIRSEEMFLREVLKRNDLCQCVMRLDPTSDAYELQEPFDDLVLDDYPRSYGDGMCFNCFKIAEVPYVCARCEQITYCGVECQTEDYKAHKKYCRLGDRRPTWWGRAPNMTPQFLDVDGIERMPI